jgi:hypothetical protein
MPSVISRAKISAFLQSIVMLPFSRFITRTISHAISLLKLDRKRRNALDVLPGFPKPSGKNYQMPSPRCMQLVAVTQPVHFFLIGKQKFYKVVKNSDRFKEVLAQMGNTFDLDLDLFPVFQEMIATCYGIKSCTKINEARYRKFCTKAKIPDHQQLPPTVDELLLHCKRAITSLVFGNLR